MPLQIIRNDLTLMTVDAIVNPTNQAFSGQGGLDKAIHQAAGPGLMEECRRLGRCRTGQARITNAYQLPCRYVIHTAGPVWRGGWLGEKEKLAACYRNALKLAQETGCQSVAFPLISAGTYGYPPRKALQTAMDTIRDFLLKAETDMQVYIVLFDKTAIEAGSSLLGDVQQYIDDHYVEEHFDFERENRRRHGFDEWDDLPDEYRVNDGASMPAHSFSDFGFGYSGAAAYGDEDAACDMSDTGSWDVCEPWPEEEARTAPPPPVCASMAAPLSLEEELEMIDESFSQMVLRKIKEKGMKNAECYKKANLDKKLFSKINNDVHYKPKKQTALALAIALEMDLDETKELLMKAGLALSRSEKFDIIVEYFIKKRQYDLFEINEVLFYYDQPLLGCVAA